MTTEQQEARRHPIPGDIIDSQWQLDVLPVGTHLAELAGGSGTWRKKDTDTEPRWQQPGGYWMDRGTEWETLSRLDSRLVVDTINARFEETPEQFAARFRDIIFWNEEAHYSSDHISEQVVNDLGGEFHFKPTVGMRVHSRHDQRMLPPGTRVYTGDPEVSNSFGLWLYEGGRWVKVFGGSNARQPDTSNPAVIDAIPDGDSVVTEPDEWWSAIPKPEDEERVHQMRLKAWNRGWQEKVERGWCATYESVLKRAGLDPDITRTRLPGGLHYGQVVTPEQAALLPVDTMLYSTHPVNVYRRVNRSTNRAGTRGVLPGKPHYADQMTVVAPDQGGVDQVERFQQAGHLLPVLNYLMLDGLPPGSIINYISRPDSDYYTKGERGAWNPCTSEGTVTSGYDYGADAFSSTTPIYGIVRIGEST